MTVNPNRLGRYELIRRVAVGGMAELYLALLLGPYGFKKTVAIKKIRADLNRHQRFRKMFLHESKLMAALNHRNLVQVFELGETNDQLFMCLEYVDGKDLHRILTTCREKKQFVPASLAAWIAREVCRGLGYVHNLHDEENRHLHIVHRDVNPGNIFLSRDGEVKLGDFGIAKSIVTNIHTTHGYLRGKLQYLSPEQARGDSVGPSSDLYTLGLVLFEMLSLECFLQGTREIDVVKNASSPVWRAIGPINPAVPHSLEEIVRRALRPKPEDRFGSAEAFEEALTDFLASQPQPADVGDVARWVAENSDPLGAESEPNKHSHDMQAPMANPIGSPQPGEFFPFSSETPSPELKPQEDAEPKVGTRTIEMAGELEKSSGGTSWSRKWWWVLLSGSILVIAGGLILFPEVLRPKPKPTKDVQALVDNSSKPQSMQKPSNDTQSTSLPDPIKKDGDSQNSTLVVQAETKIFPTPLVHGKKSRKEKKEIAKDNSTVSTKPNLDALKQNFSRLKQRLKMRGIRPKDSEEIDRWIQKTASQINKNEQTAAAESLGNLEKAVDKISLDQNFIESKLQRLHRLLEKKGLKSKYSSEVQEILDHTLNSRFVEANQAINRIFDRVE